MENKIIFLLVICLCLWFIFSDKGREWLEYYVGIKIAKKGSNSVNSENMKNSQKYSGDFGNGKVA